MQGNLIYLVLMAVISLVPGLLLGALVSLIDGDLGIITTGVVFGWQFIELISKRKSNW